MKIPQKNFQISLEMNLFQNNLFKVTVQSTGGFGQKLTDFQNCFK